jgi:hypothetical protein
MLDAPPEVQRAFERDELTQHAVLQVVSLDVDAQEAIADRIREGETPAEVVAEVLQRPAQAAQAAQRAFKSLITDLGNARRKLKGSIGEISTNSHKHKLELLREWRDELIPRLIERIEADEADGNDLSFLDEFVSNRPGQNDRFDDQQEQTDSPDDPNDKLGGAAPVKNDLVQSIKDIVQESRST